MNESQRFVNADFPKMSGKRKCRTLPKLLDLRNPRQRYIRASASSAASAGYPYIKKRSAIRAADCGKTVGQRMLKSARALKSYLHFNGKCLALGNGDLYQ